MSKRIRVDVKNFNKHTPEGMELLEKSISEVGAIESVNSAKINIPKKGGTNFYFTSKTLSLLDVLNWVEINLGKIEEATVYNFYRE